MIAARCKTGTELGLQSRPLGFMICWFRLALGSGGMLTVLPVSAGDGCCSAFRMRHKFFTLRSSKPCDQTPGDLSYKAGKFVRASRRLIVCSRVNPFCGAAWIRVNIL
jgi:hypothetical protein